MDMGTPDVKSILKRKREYLMRFDRSIKALALEEQKAQKRTREEMPSYDDQLQSTQRPEQQHLPKRKKQIEQKPLKEEVLTPKISSYSTSFLGLSDNSSICSS